MDKDGGQSMSFSSDLWNKFAESKEFREEYAAALVKRAFALQVRTLRKGREMSQNTLADAAKIDQGVISRAENPNYGNLTFNTGIRIAAGFDLAFIPRIVTYSEFLKWAEEIGEGLQNLKPFEQEREEQESQEQPISQAIPKSRTSAAEIIPKKPPARAEEKAENTPKASAMDLAAAGNRGQLGGFPKPQEEGIPYEILSEGIGNEIISRRFGEGASVC